MKFIYVSIKYKWGTEEAIFPLNEFFGIIFDVEQKWIEIKFSTKKFHGESEHFDMFEFQKFLKDDRQIFKISLDATN